MKAGLRFYGERPDPRSDLSKLIEAVNVAAKREVVDDANALLTLRKMRNTVMHDGIQQESGTAHTNAIRARDAMRRVASQVFGVDLANLHLGEFISSEQIRSLLGEASKYFDSEQYREAVGYALAAFDQLMYAWTAYNQKLFDLREPPSDKFARIIGTLSAGVYLPSLQRFREATDRIHAQVTAGGKVFLSYTGMLDNPVEMEKRARYALDFVGGLALQIEARLGGRRAW